MWHVLVVDDDPEIAELFQSILDSSGYRVSVALNGQDALALDAADPIDALITDVAMPGMGGSELLDALRKRHPEMPALIVSGYPGRDLVDRPRERVLFKPIRLMSLVTHLETLLGEPQDDI
jgi:CheY-like chemotaxis protein